MAKKKKKKKQRKGNPSLANLSAAELLRQGEDLLHSGKPREAIAALKMAAKKDEKKDGIDRLLFKAYLRRSMELREKNMDAEADEVLTHAHALMPPIAELTEDLLRPLIRSTDLEKAVSIYANFLKVKPPSAGIEQCLAERLLIDPQWHLLDRLDAQVSIKNNLEQMMEAVRLMTAGEWESAMKCLKPVPRSSPWVTLRMLCHAMVCFYKEDDSGMQRALSMIPEDSLLQAISRQLLNDMYSLSCLWEGPVGLADNITELLDKLNGQRYKNVDNDIRRIAGMISPRNKEIAVFHLLELIAPVLLDAQDDEYAYYNMARRLLTKPMADLITQKTELFFDPGNFYHTANYLSVLDMEFPDPDDRAMATAQVLLNTIAYFQKKSNAKVPAGNSIGQLKKILGLSSQQMNELIPEMLVYAISQDPGNRKAYEMLVALPFSNSRTIYQKIETGLLTMRKHFSDDPYPCLALAKLYYRRNAYRKAENVLNTAMTLAPHDVHVINMHILSLLISAGKNIQQGKLHLAHQDMDHAEAIITPDTRFLMIEKQILLQTLDSGQQALFKAIKKGDPGDVRRVIEAQTQSLSLFECLRVLGALLLDVSHPSNRYGWNKKMIQALDKVLKSRLKSIGQLTSSEVCALLMPLQLELPVLAGNTMVHFFMTRCKNMLSRLDAQHLFGVLEHLLYTREYKWVLKEIKRRKKNCDEASWRMLRFYELTVKHLNGDLYNDAFSYMTLLDNVPESDMNAFQAAARRLSAYVPNNMGLKMALENFNFKYLVIEDFFGEYDDDDDEYDDDEYDDDEYDDDEFLVREIIWQLEDFIVDQDLIGAPKKLLLKFRKDLFDSPVPFPLPFDLFISAIDEEMRSEMSRELRILLFKKA